MKELTIVTYHYVRELESSKYPEIKGLELSKFIKQLNYFKDHYQFVSIDDVINYVYNNKSVFIDSEEIPISRNKKTELDAALSLKHNQ